MRKFVKCCTSLIGMAVITVMSFVFYYEAQLPDKFYTHDGKLYINTKITVEGSSNTILSAAKNMGNVQNVSLKLFGIIPIKDTQVETVKEKLLVPCGNPFGIKLNTDGVLVVGIEDVSTPEGKRCPAREAGIKEGDAITSVNNQAVYTNEDIESIVKNSTGSLFISLRRGKSEQVMKITPVVDSEGVRRVGIWVRDSSAGIGTITYYDPKTNEFGGLGHPICDVDTGEIMPLLTGEVVKVSINSVVKGTAGTPGELKGSFISSFASGTIKSNSETGVFGVLYKNPSSHPAIPVALKQDIKVGPAKIYTTISGTTPKLYDIRVEKINLSDTGKTKNMVIRVTDPELLKATGGIVQGMSGSPIIQNNKLIGAITHVLVNDPKKGYAIFIENMYSKP